ncbi:TcmI family type II polyketide cyclase [Streptomyces rimosus]|uniref:TcmI family type II polyketide cyclase n=1 Tax=Streptomyces rimosus TaxID=1927 RepID=UPI0031CE2A34
MHSVVFVGTMDADAASDVADLFAEFDASDLPIVAGACRRQMFTYHDLHINVLDFRREPDSAQIEMLKTDPRVVDHERRLNKLVAPLRPDTWRGAADSAAMPFYLWHQQDWNLCAGTSHSTIVVNRMAAASIPEVSALFAELDATDFPYRMGTRRRQLFSHHGVYLHIQDFPAEDGGEKIAHAWKEQDPRFVKICRELDPFMHVYDPATWRSTADQLATRFYHWESKA